MQRGLFILRRMTSFKNHVGILVVGSPPLANMPFGALGLLIHFNQAGLHREVVYDLNGWTIQPQIVGNENDIIARLNHVLNSNQTYALLNNNCEHLVSYVETGERKSPQVRGWAAAAAIVAGLVLLSRSA